jgi:hypothetical protein
MGADKRRLQATWGLALSYGAGTVVCRPLVDLVLNISKYG